MSGFGFRADRVFGKEFVYGLRLKVGASRFGFGVLARGYGPCCVEYNTKGFTGPISDFCKSL